VSIRTEKLEVIMLERAVALEDDFPLWPPGEERRSAVRYPTALFANCHLVTDGGGGPRRAQVCDLSALGVALSLQDHLAPGAFLEFDLERQAEVVLHGVQARVVHVRSDPTGGWIIGCALIRELSNAELRFFQAERMRPRAPDCRRWVRFPCDVETACYTRETAPGERRPARAVNISAGGVGLLLPCEFTAGTLLYLEFPGPGTDPVGKVLIRVTRAAEDGHGNWFLGCEFARQLSAAELDGLVG
jgi:hypothetical protein